MFLASLMSTDNPLGPDLMQQKICLSMTTVRPRIIEQLVKIYRRKSQTLPVDVLLFLLSVCPIIWLRRCQIPLRSIDFDYRDDDLPIPLLTHLISKLDK